MLSVGEVKRVVVDKAEAEVFVYLHPGAVIDGVEYPARTSSRVPQFSFSVASVEWFERHVEEAQNEPGIPPEERIGVQYQSPPTPL